MHQERSTSFDVLRALSVLYIVGFWHGLGYSTAMPGYANAITYRITVVVLGLFVFLSGYLLATRDISSASDISAFYKRRLARIWPLYIIALSIFMLCGLTSARTALLSALGLSMFYGELPMTLWFVVMLLALYAVAPLLIAAARSPLVFVVTSAALFLFAARYTTDPRLAIYLPAFALGVLTSKYRDAVRSVSPIYLGLIAVGSVLISAISRDNPEKALASVSMAAAVPMLILFLVERRELSAKSIRFFDGLSYASFAMYLFHRPIYMLYAPHFPERPVYQLAVLWGLALPTIALGSYAVQISYDHLAKAVQPRRQDKNRNKT